MKTNLINFSLIGALSASSLLNEFKEKNLESKIIKACNIQMYRFEYSTFYKGKTHTASASISFPLSSNLKQTNKNSVLVYNHGTLTLREQISSMKGFDTNNDGLLSKLFCANQYITVIPDYLGFGVSQILHPYLHAESLAKTIKDAICAANTICKELEYTHDSKLFITGYSEGGFATMAAQELIEREPLEEIKLKACAPLGGPYDLSGTMLELMLSKTPYPAPSYAPYILLAYNKIYNFQENIEELFKTPLAAKLEKLFDGTHSREEIEESLPEIPIKVLRDDIIEAIIKEPEHPIRKAIAQNDVYRFKPKSKTRLFHNPTDATVPIENAKVAQQHFASCGIKDIELTEVKAESHSEAALPCILEAIKFFRELN